MKIRLFALIPFVILSACSESEPNDDSARDAKPAIAAASSSTMDAVPNDDATKLMSDGLAQTAGNIVANAAGEVRRVDAPLFDDFELDLDHAIVMERTMQIGPSRMKDFDLELFEVDSTSAVDALRRRLEAAGFQLNSEEHTEGKDAWDYRRYAGSRNLQGILVGLTLKPLRSDRAPQHAQATARLSLKVSDSR